MLPSSKDYCIEESPSSRATCTKCNTNIDKGVFRIKYFDGVQYGIMQYRYMHIKCGIPQVEEEIEDLIMLAEFGKKYIRKNEMQKKQ